MNMLNLEKELIKEIYQETGIAREKNKQYVSDIEFEMAIAVKVDHKHQLNFLEHRLEWFLENKKLIDKLCQLFLDYESKWMKKNG